MPAQHDRTIFHSGTQDTTTVVLSTAVGPHPPGTTLQAVLADFVYRLTALEASGHPFTLDALLEAVEAFTFNLDAALIGPQGSFTLDANLRGLRTFSLDAFLV